MKAFSLKTMSTWKILYINCCPYFIPVSFYITRLHSSYNLILILNPWRTYLTLLRLMTSILQKQWGKERKWINFLVMSKNNKCGFKQINCDHFLLHIKRWIILSKLAEIRRFLLSVRNNIRYIIYRTFLILHFRYIHIQRTDRQAVLTITKHVVITI